MNTEAAFAHALLDPQPLCPRGLRSWNGSDPAIRFGIYRNNIIVSLLDALAEQFPVTQELVGAEFFRAMARVFLYQQPPRSRLIAFVGQRFADCIAGFAPAATVPYLADVCRLEMARILACHAADADTLSADAIGAALADPQQLGQLQFALHPSMQLHNSDFAIFSLWAAHQGELDIARVDPQVGQHVLVFRDGLDVQTVQIDAGAHLFLSQLQAGATLAQAADLAAQAHPDLDLPGAIALLLRYPLVIQMESSP